MPTTSKDLHLPYEVWETLRRFIVEQLGVPLEAVTADAFLVDNLGAD